MKRTGQPATAKKTFRSWQYAGKNQERGTLPLVMGIVNVTPDSFSDGGNYNTTHAAVAHALGLVEQGADILDIGGESTRPDAPPVDPEEELARVIPVIEQLSKQVEVPVSIDTFKAKVARAAIEAGATIVNDISGLQFDPEMIPLCAELKKVGIICMHIQGTPQTMQQDPQYKNVVQEINQFFSERLKTMTEAGIAPERIVLDPGIGFGKTAEHNLEILRNVDQFHQLGRPLLVGHSRKRFIGKLLNRKVDERLWGTVGISIGLAQADVEILRVHDVRATVDSLQAWRLVCPNG